MPAFCSRRAVFTAKADNEIDRIFNEKFHNQNLVVRLLPYKGEIPLL